NFGGSEELDRIGDFFLSGIGGIDECFVEVVVFFELIDLVLEIGDLLVVVFGEGVAKIGQRVLELGAQTRGGGRFSGGSAGEAGERVELVAIEVQLMQSGQGL